MARKFSYTPEQMAFLANHIKGTSYRVLAEMFNSRFGLNKTVEAIKSICQYRGMHNGVNTRYSTGHFPENRFSEGNIPGNYRPPGSEVIDSYGFVAIKVADPDCWRLKHHVIWEEKNGALPKGGIVIFADGDKRNFNPENLIMLTPSQFCWIRGQKLLSKDVDMNRTVVLIAKVASRVAQLKKTKEKL